MNTKGLEPIDLRIGLLFGTVLLLVLALTLVQDKYANDKPFMYDTDPRCDSYIRNELSNSQLEQLDEVLCVEFKNKGQLVTEHTIKKIVGSNNYSAISAAYARWRECKELNRNIDHVVYPRTCTEHHSK